LTVCCLVVTAAVVHRELAVGRRNPPSAHPPELVPDWQKLRDVGIAFGARRAPISIVEFADFECPYCRRADSVLRSIDAMFPGKTEIIYVHFPISGHRFARPAARAAECAADQSKFMQMHHLLFAKQDSLGLKPWRGYAADAGIPDLDAFDRCTASNVSIPRVEAGIAAGNALHVTGTPTLILNGWRYFSPPTEQELAAAIRHLLVGRGLDGRRRG
jgi:protein-disulfide isomerase